MPRREIIEDPELGPLTDDALAGSWRVWQRRRGHRYSIDDVLTAWEAARERAEARRFLDLGCGLGSVLLMVLYRLGPEARAVGIEAQAGSFALAGRNVERNGLRPRVSLHLGDLRDADRRQTLGGPFELITATPPYLRPNEGTPSSRDPQRTYARLEMRGGVEDYLEAAGDLLAPQGRVIVCCDAKRPERALEGGRRAGLEPLRRRDVIPREGTKGPLFSVWTFARSGEAPPFVEVPAFVARDADGARTEAERDVRRFFGLEAPEGETPSPGRVNQPSNPQSQRRLRK